MEIIQIINAAASIAMVVALIYTILEFRRSSKFSKTTFLLDLRDKFMESKRYNIHIALERKEDINNESDLNDYLGLFEVCEIMIENGALELTDFTKLYKYRLENILGNKKIVFNKLVNEYEYWKSLYNLLNRCFSDYKKEFRELTKMREKKTGIDDDSFIKIIDKLSKISN